MLFKIKSYFLFLLHSTNQHGVHSPFIFKLVTECFYKKMNVKSVHLPFYMEKNTTSKQKKLLRKINAYFSPKNKKYVPTALKEENSFCKYDFIIFETPNLKLFKKQLFYAHNNTVFIVKNVYQSSDSLKKWKEILNSTQAVVTIDIYYLGLIFIRKEQLKQHFCIRC